MVVVSAIAGTSIHCICLESSIIKEISSIVVETADIYSTAVISWWFNICPIAKSNRTKTSYWSSRKDYDLPLIICTETCSRGNIDSSAVRNNNLNTSANTLCRWDLPNTSNHNSSFDAHVDSSDISIPSTYNFVIKDIVFICHPMCFSSRSVGIPIASVRFIQFCL